MPKVEQARRSIRTRSVHSGSHEARRDRPQRSEGRQRGRWSRRQKALTLERFPNALTRFGWGVWGVWGRGPKRQGVKGALIIGLFARRREPGPPFIVTRAHSTL